MNFITIKNSITNILGLAESGRYRTVGFQRQTRAAEEVKGNNRQVTVFFSRGDFPKSSGRNTGPVQHDITYRIELIVSSAAKMDLSIINNPSSTPEQKAVALAAAHEAAALADELMDELWSIIYQILMDGRNVDMGLSVGTVANRWIDSFQKDEPRTRGKFVVLTGIGILTLRTGEQVSGDTGAPGANIINTTFDIKDNIPGIAGVWIDNT